MKTDIQIIAVFAAALIFALAVKPGTVQAGDDAVFQLTVSADAGAGAECHQTALKPKTHYAIQPTVNVYVRVSQVPDGGQAASSANVRVDANKLYDVWTTADQRYLCAKPVSAGASATVNGFLYREGTQ